MIHLFLIDIDPFFQQLIDLSSVEAFLFVRKIRMLKIKLNINFT